MIDDKDYINSLKIKFNIENDDLTIIKVKYINFLDEEMEGFFVCNKSISKDLEEIFKVLYEEKYQIEKIKLIDEYNFDDLLSMEDNNTSCFNYRVIKDTNILSRHSFGLAVDINPVYNPYYVSKTQILPVKSRKYIDRSKDFPHKIDEFDLCYKLFIEHGFKWGGYFKYPDYQHFEK